MTSRKLMLDIEYGGTLLFVAEEKWPFGTNKTVQDLNKDRQTDGWTDKYEQTIVSVLELILSKRQTLFVWFDSLHPINNLSVIKGRIFLGWTSTKLGQMCLVQGPRRSDAGEVRPCGASVSSQALYHWATALLLREKYTQEGILVFGFVWGFTSQSTAMVMSRWQQQKRKENFGVKGVCFINSNYPDVGVSKWCKHRSDQ